MRNREGEVSGEQHAPDQSLENQKIKDSITRAIRETETGEERVAAVLHTLQPILEISQEANCSDDIKTVLAQIEPNLRALAQIQSPEEFIDTTTTLISESLLEAQKKNPELFERMTRKKFVQAAGFESLDPENFISYDIGSDHWARIHVAPGKTLGDRILPFMAEGLEKLIAIADDKKLKGISATSYLVASKKYSAILERLGFTMEGEINTSDRAAQFPQVDKKTPIHKARLHKENFQKAQKFLQELLAKQKTNT